MKGKRIQRSATGEHSGFTLIELLVAMTILVIIMLIIAMIFQRATAAWDAGSRKVEADLTGRSVADFIAQELSMAVRDTNQYASFTVEGNMASFFLLGDADTNGNRAVRQVTYSGAGGSAALAEGVREIRYECTPSNAPAPDLPRYADVWVTVTNSLGETMYQSRAYFMNRDRNRF